MQHLLDASEIEGGTIHTWKREQLSSLVLNFCLLNHFEGTSAHEPNLIGFSTVLGDNMHARVHIDICHTFFSTTRGQPDDDINYNQLSCGSLR